MVSYYTGKNPWVVLTCEHALWEPGDEAIINWRLKDELNEYYLKDGMRFLGWIGSSSSLSFAGNKLLKTPGDLKGLKVRAPGAVVTAIEKAGGVGVSIANPEIYQALQRGTVDMVHSSLPTFKTQRLWEVASSFTLATWGGGSYQAVMNEKKWQSLPDDIKAAFEKVSKEMVPWTYDHARGILADQVEYLKTQFKEFYTWNAEEEALWRDLEAGYVANNLIKEEGAPAQELWDKVKAIAEECKEARAAGKTPNFYD